MYAISNGEGGSQCLSPVGLKVIMWPRLVSNLKSCFNLPGARNMNVPPFLPVSTCYQKSFNWKPIEVIKVKNSTKCSRTIYLIPLQLIFHHVCFITYSNTQPSFLSYFLSSPRLNLFHWSNGEHLSKSDGFYGGWLYLISPSSTTHSTFATQATAVFWKQKQIRHLSSQHTLRLPKLKP